MKVHVCRQDKRISIYGLACRGGLHYIMVKCHATLQSVLGLVECRMALDHDVVETSPACQICLISCNMHACTGGDHSTRCTALPIKVWLQLTVSGKGNDLGRVALRCCTRCSLIGSHIEHIVSVSHPRSSGVCLSAAITLAIALQASLWG